MSDERVDLRLDGITSARLVRRGDDTELYQAVQKQFGRKVAVKIYIAEGVRDTALARFERECKLMGDLSSHPNVVTYFESGVKRRRPYVVSEWLDEGTFHNRITRGAAVDWNEAVNIGVKIAGALESAHRLGLLHRKLKPQDLFVSPFGEPLVGDFQLDPSEASRSGDVYDIMLHAAPEQFRGAPTSPQSDVYALASVIYTLILGRAPFVEAADEPLVRIKGRALSMAPPDLSWLSVPAPVVAVLRWGLLVDTGRRPRTALELGRALQAALAAAGREPARLLVRPQTDYDRSLPSPTVPAAALELMTGGARPAAPPPPPGAGRAAPPPPPPPPRPPGADAASARTPPTGPVPQVPSAPPPPPPRPPSPAPVPAPGPAAPLPPAATAVTGVGAPTAVVEQVRQLIRLAHTFYVDPLELQRLREIEARLDEPLRVAIAGKVKAGKSTLLNGLVGEQLAPTDASECTRIVTWYVNGLGYHATLHLAGGEQVNTPFSRQAGAIDVDLQGHPADTVEQIVVEWPSSALTELSLIDTPGIASISTDISARTHRFVLAEPDHESQADAVVYLMRHLHPTDVRFLESFQDTQVGRTNPINAIGVLSRADELAGAQDDALDAANSVAARYRTSPQVRRLCQTVVPIAGLLAQASATFRQSDYNLLERIAALAAADVEMLLASADRFVDNDLVANVVATDREHLIRSLGLYGVRRAVRAIRNQHVADTPQLARMLFEESGLGDLRRILMSQFASRRDVLKAQAALQALTQRLRVAPPPSGLDRLQFELERIRSTAHVFAEIELFAAVRSGVIPLPDAELDSVERLLGAEGYAPTMRLGLADSSTADVIRAALNDRVRVWRARAENPLSSREVSDAAQVLVRTCEGMLRAMHVEQPLTR